MKCPYCGRESNSDKLYFCQNCGANFMDGDDAKGILTEESPEQDQPAQKITEPLPEEKKISGDQPVTEDQDKVTEIKANPVMKGIIVGMAAFVLLCIGLIAGIGIAGRSSAVQSASADTTAEADSFDQGEGQLSGNSEKEAGDTVTETEQNAENESDSQTEDTGDSQSEAEDIVSYAAVSMSHVADTEGSSVLQESAGTHWAKYICDDNLATAWVEGVSGQGEGESVTITFDGVYCFSGFRIYNGYQKSSDLYSKNSRPSRLQLDFSDGTSEIFDLKDAEGEQGTDLTVPANANSVTITILGVYAGYKYTDTCISEIEFY